MTLTRSYLTAWLVGAALGAGVLCGADAPPTARPTLAATTGHARYFMLPSTAKDLISPEQSPEEQASADAAWAHVFDPVEGRSIEFVGEDGKPSNVMLGDALRRQQPGWAEDPKENAWTERARCALRERGLKFWDDHPKDVRRYVWLLQTSNPGPFYWKDVAQGAQAWSDWLKDHASRAISTVPIDLAAKTQWEARYISLRAEFFASTVLEDGAKALLRSNEMCNRIFHEFHHNMMPDSLSQTDVALRWTRLLAEFFDLAERSPDSVKTPLANISWLLDHEASFYPDVYPKLRTQLLAAAKLSSADDLKDFAVTASEDPVEVAIGKPVPGLRFMTLKNQDVDRKVWHGKVVLLDFWAFWCHSCIEAMPHLKTIYEKYHDQGFEIYGVCFAEKGETPKQIVGLAQKLGLPWDQAMRAPLLKDRFGRLYGFTALPQLMLLDKDGNLAGQNIYEYPALEAKIQELLAQKQP